MGLRIVAAGSNMLIAEEVSNAVRVIVGDVAEITAVTTPTLHYDRLGAIYLCAVTQKDHITIQVPL